MTKYSITPNNSEILDWEDIKDLSRNATKGTEGALKRAKPYTGRKSISLNEEKSINLSIIIRETHKKMIDKLGNTYCGNLKSKTPIVCRAILTVAFSSDDIMEQVIEEIKKNIK